jgi:hypothetical protein
MANTKITSRVLADNAVLTANITDANVTTAKVADNAVTGDKVADDVALAGNPTTTTQSAGNNTTRIATTAFVSTAVANLADSAPDALNTLNELAAAMGDDANFSTTVTNSIAAKLPLAGGTMTGNIVMGDDTSIGIADDAERIEFDGAGDINILGANLGIGTTSPLDALHISSAVSSDYRGNLFLDDSTTGYAAGVGGQITFGAEYRSNGDHTEWAAIQGAKANSTDADYAGTLEFKTRANGGALQVKMVLDDTGQLGIGTTSPDYRLVVKGAAATNDNIFKIEDSAGTKMASMEQDSSGNGRWIVCDTSGNADVLIHTAGNSYFNGGNVGIGTTSPSPTDWGSASPVVQISGTQPLLSLKDSDVTDGEFHLANSQQNFYIYDAAASATRLFIKSDGTIGIGTTTPATKLDLYDGSSNAAVQMAFENDARAWRIGVHGGISDSFTVYDVTANATRMVVNSSGNVGIGTTSAGDRLQVLNDLANHAAVNITSTSAAATEYGISVSLTNSPNDGTRYFLACSDSSTTRAVIRSNGNLQNANNSYGQISDSKLKENIVDATDKLSDLKKVKVRNFNFIGSDLKQIGVVAQELETIFPSMVEETIDIDSDNNELETTTKSVKYSIFVPILVKAIQELTTKLETAEARIKTLEDA